jgi:N-acetyl-1-D-myo-inositol-2-amino-2-deoxy-alpha-D-glucopyranoside deacetylase
MVERVLFVHAHPDDETLTTGATIATLVDRGSMVAVLTCTRGELGGIVAPDLQHLDPDALGEHRSSELAAALAALGVDDHRFLGSTGARWEGRPERRYRDSGMRWDKSGPQPPESLDPGSLLAAESGEVAADIAAAILAVKPDVVVSYGADGGYGHPDHVRVHEATRTATDVLGVPFYAIGGTSRAQVRVDPVPVLDRKRRAIQAHRSQLTIDGHRVVISPTLSEPIAAVETFRRLRPAGNSFADLGLGAKIVTCLLALVLGVFVGATLTVAHQAAVTVAGVRIPWGIIASIVITAALIVGLRIVFETRIVAGVAALGLLGASAFLALQSSGGSILVPDNTIGYVWTFAPVIIAGLALAWPRVRRPAGSNIEGTSAKGSVPL